MPHFAVAVMGRDRPGIVAQVSGVLLRLECNVQDVATSILSGHFALMLICSAPPNLSSEELSQALQPLSTGPGLRVAAWQVDGAPAGAIPSHVLTVYGRDTPGIVHAVAAALAESNVNICDMTCRLHQGEDPVYVLTTEVQLPAGAAAQDVLSAVTAGVRAMGLETSLREIEREEL